MTRITTSRTGSHPPKRNVYVAVSVFCLCSCCQFQGLGIESEGAFLLLHPIVLYRVDFSGILKIRELRFDSVQYSWKYYFMPFTLYFIIIMVVVVLMVNMAVFLSMAGSINKERDDTQEERQRQRRETHTHRVTQGHATE